MPTNAGGGPISPDLRDLIVRLDQRVSDGSANMEKKFDRIEQRGDKHEQKLDDHEKRILGIETTGKNAVTFGRMLWAMLGSSGATALAITVLRHFVI